MLDGYSPGWPTAIYEFSLVEAHAEDDADGSNRAAEVEIEIAYDRFDFAVPASELRIVEWDGKTYRDITIEVDTQRSVVRGRTHRLKRYALVQRLPPQAETASPQ